MINGRMCGAIGDENRPSPGHEEFSMSYDKKPGTLDSGNFQSKKARI